MESARPGRLGSLRGANVGPVGDWQDEPLGVLWSRLINAGACRRVVGRHSGSQESKDECQCLGVRFCLVPHCPGRLTLINARGNERQCFASSSGWLGGNLQQLLEILGSPECARRGPSLASEFAAQTLLATGIVGVQPATSAEREQFDHLTLGWSRSQAGGTPAVPVFWPPLRRTNLTPHLWN